MKRAMLIVGGILVCALGVVFAAIAGTAIGVLATHTYRLRSSPMIAFSIFGPLAYLSFLVARGVFRSIRHPT
jgi:hypothetical protein